MREHVINPSKVELRRRQSKSREGQKTGKIGVSNLMVTIKKPSFRIRSVGGIKDSVKILGAIYGNHRRCRTRHVFQFAANGILTKTEV